MIRKTFGLSEFQAMWVMPGAKGWAYFNWATEKEASFFGGGYRKTTKGYIAQEIELVKTRKKKRNGGRTT